MSIQNLSIIFIVIAIPIIIVSSYYVTQQQETLKMQASYDSKLGEATREAIKAYEINTVEWANEKENTRDHTMAAMNVFMTSLANQLNISGTAKEYMQNHIPAMAMTMYDGYYIYAPAYVPVTLKNEDGTQLFYDSEENILTTTSENFAGEDFSIIYEPAEDILADIIKSTIYNGKTYKFVTEINNAKKDYIHTLTNQIPYSERYNPNSDIDVVINYTLDNLMYVYGYIGDEYVEKKGYLLNFGDMAYTNEHIIPQQSEGLESLENLSNEFNVLYRKGMDEYDIKGEYLKEQILYFEDGEYNLGTFNYVYDSEETKLYYDDIEGEFFSLTKDRTRSFISNSSRIRYKAVSVLRGDTEVECTKFYQALNGTQKGCWFFEENPGQLSLSSLPTNLDIKLDYSAVSYYVEAYAFTNWVSGVLGRSGGGYLRIGNNNDPEDENSLFSQHRKDVIKKTITDNLNIAISNYAQGGIYDFRLPVLTDSDWDQIYRNISLITFFQGVPIGTKHYNNYAIATSSTNRELVNPAELYVVSNNDSYYHKPLCNQIRNTGYTAYKSIDFELKEKYISEELGYAKYYAQPKKACYYCIINRANYTITDNMEEIRTNQVKAYYTALARERYINANT